MSSERSGNEKYKSKNSPLQEYGGKKKWSSRGELSAGNSSTLEYPSKNSKKVGSLSDDEDERNSTKKKRKLFAFSSKSKRERIGSGDLKKKSKNKDEVGKDGNQKQRASRSNTISELSVTQLQKKRLSREVTSIFGLNLEDAVKQSKSLDGIELPIVIRECVDYVEEFGLDTPGIYRISGIKSKIEALKSSYNTGRSVDLKEYDVTVVTGLLKLYLRELPESVLTQECNPKFEEAAAEPNEKLRVEEFRGALQELPSCNLALLSWVITHLIHVLDHAEINKMSIQNLTIVFSPTMRISHRVMFYLFTNWKTLFGHVNLKKCRKPLQLDPSGQVQLPDSIGELEDELQFHEMLLTKMHEDLNKGIASHDTEEELWEVQRIVTQIKRNLRKAKSAEKQATTKPQEDDKSDSVDQKSTDSKIEEGSSTGTDENKLSESEKDANAEESPKEEVKMVPAAAEDVTSKEEPEVKPTSPEEVKVEIHEDEEKLQLPEEKQDEEESFESLFLFYSELMAKQKELNNIRTELQRRIEMEKLEVSKLQAEVEAAKVAPKVRASTSSNADVSDSSSSDSEDEEELQAILKKLLEDNERLKKDNTESSLLIFKTREECADLKAKLYVEDRRSEIIRDLQDELEKDKAKKEEREQGEEEEKSEKGDDTTKAETPEGCDVFSAGDSEC